MIIDRIVSLKEDIRQTALRCGRDPAEIKLLAVSKSKKVEQILVALDNGIDCIAESYVNDCLEKIPLLNGHYSEFHYIGHLQTNKIKKLLPLKPTLIHSIFKYNTAEKLNQALAELSNMGADTDLPPHITQDILIEVNTSGEDSKQGCHPLVCPHLINQINDMPHLKVRGLMTIGTLTDNEAHIRHCFKLLKGIFDKIKAKEHSYRNVKMDYLSMGMSGDYRIAIEEGANMLRIGTLIFGERTRRNKQ